MKPMEELTTAELTPLPEPERSLRSAINKMVEANNADRKKLDWQVRVYVKVP
jgi:ribosomal protein L13